MINIEDFVERWGAAHFTGENKHPWDATSAAEEIVNAALTDLDENYFVAKGTAVHATATVEEGAVLKAPCLIGPGCLVASNAYLRGGVFLDRNCIVGPCCELKSTFMFEGSKVAHLSFVGDSIIGAAANIEAGTIIANYRNELADKRIWIAWNGGVIDTGVSKFGALIGDRARIGANSVIAPGALINRDQVVPRLSLVDQYPGSAV